MKSGYRRYDAASIKSKIAPHDFYLREQSLDQFKNKSHKWAEAGLCPFHNDSSAGSFKVNCESGAFICFSCGEKGGDIIHYMQKKYELQFREALQRLGSEWGVV